VLRPLLTPPSAIDSTAFRLCGVQPAAEIRQPLRGESSPDLAPLAPSHRATAFDSTAFRPCFMQPSAEFVRHFAEGQWPPQEAPRHGSTSMLPLVPRSRIEAPRHGSGIRIVPHPMPPPHRPTRRPGRAHRVRFFVSSVSFGSRCPPPEPSPQAEPFRRPTAIILLRRLCGMPSLRSGKCVRFAPWQPA